MFCCCCGYQDNGVRLTRRSLLGVAAGLVVAGCRPKRARPAASPHADTAALTAAAEAEEALLADYDLAIAATDAVVAGRLGLARDRHAAHLQALRSAGSGAGPSATPPATSGTDLAPSLRSSALALRPAAVSARSGQAAALLASIRAEHAADATSMDVTR
jgi:hypothetical protein